MKCLSDLKSGVQSRVVKIRDDGNLARRVRELGICTGVYVELVRQAPLRDPLMVKVGDTLLAIRRKEAACIFVELGITNE